MKVMTRREYDSPKIPEIQSSLGRSLPIAIGAGTRSIQRSAKLAGALYLLIAILAIFVHMYVPGQLVVPGDATGTASKIVASMGLFRIGIASELVLLLSEIAVSIILYGLLKPVDKSLALMATVSRLIMTTIHGVNVLNHIVVALLLSGAGYLTVFAPDQLNALVMLFLDTYTHGFNIGIVFFTLHVVLLGYLIFRSGYFPRTLGVLFVIASMGYLIDSFTFVLLDIHRSGDAYFAIPIAIAEIAFPLWLLIKGVNAEKWEKRALTSG